jgi:SAM-dependent methyltransferase
MDTHRWRGIVPPVGFDLAYRSGVPPWDIGRPQPVLVRLVDEGAIAGSVVDLGCGTGENAIYLASRGCAVVGIDSAPTAIASAWAKAAGRSSTARFLVADALELERLEEPFDAAVDIGLFHTFSDADRVRFARSLQAILRPGARYHMLCFSELQQGGLGPRRVTQAEIRRTFDQGWRVDAIVPERFAARVPGGGAYAWLASLTRR